MTITFDSTNSSAAPTSTGSGNTLLMPALSAAAGELILLWVQANAGPSTAITPAVTGVTWTQRASINNGGGQFLDLWFAIPSVPISGVQYTITQTGTNFLEGAFSLFTGVTNSATPYDSNGSLPATVTLAGNPPVAQITTSNANDVLVGFANNASVGVGSGYTTQLASSFMTIVYQIVSATVSGSTPITSNAVAIVGDAYTAATAAPAQQVVTGWVTHDW